MVELNARDFEAAFFFVFVKKIYCPSWTASKRKRKIQKKVDRNFHCVFHFYRVGIKREGIKKPLRNKLVYDDETSSILMNVAGARTRTILERGVTAKCS